MRVTTNTMTDTLVRYLAMQNSQLFKLQQNISSQKRINKPSDDPVGMGKILNYRNNIATVDQYLDNIEQAKSRIEFSEMTLDMVDETLDVIRAISKTEATGTTTSRNIAADQVKDLYNQVVDLANSKFGQNFMFSGYQTDTPAYSHTVEISGGTADTINFGLSADSSNVTLKIQDNNGNVLRTLAPADIGPGSDGINNVVWDGRDDGGNLLADGLYIFTVEAFNASNDPVADYAVYNGDDGSVTYILGEGTRLSLDADGRNIFSPENPDGTPAGINIFEVLADLIYALENDDTSAIADQTKLLDRAHTQISEIRAANSPRMYQLETTEEFWSNYKPKLQELLAKTEEVDLNEAVMQLKNIELAYQTTLATAARIIQPSLLNFLK